MRSNSKRNHFQQLNDDFCEIIDKENMQPGFIEKKCAFKPVDLKNRPNSAINNMPKDLSKKEQPKTKREDPKTPIVPKRESFWKEAKVLKRVPVSFEAFKGSALDQLKDQVSSRRELEIELHPQRLYIIKYHPKLAEEDRYNLCKNLVILEEHYPSVFRSSWAVHLLDLLLSRYTSPNLRTPHLPKLVLSIITTVIKYRERTHLNCWFPQDCMPTQHFLAHQNSQEVQLMSKYISDLVWPLLPKVLDIDPIDYFEMCASALFFNSTLRAKGLLLIRLALPYNEYLEYLPSCIGVSAAVLSRESGDALSNHIVNSLISLFEPGLVVACICFLKKCVRAEGYQTSVETVI
jgi:hypothetical protein